MEMNSLTFYRNRIDKKASKLNRPRPVPDYLRPMLDGHREVDVADMGSGPFTTIGTVCDDCAVNVRAFDLRADGYQKICNEAGIIPLVPVETQNMEETTLPSNAFDIVHCQNALDHILHPLKAVLEFARICKNGGWIYLQHYTNCGERQNYYSGHFWNLEKSGDRCRVWNRDDSFFLDDFLTGWTHHQDGRLIVSVLNLKKWQN